jgi:hypothetical protein
VNGATTVFVTDAANREILEYDATTGDLAWYSHGAGLTDVHNRIDTAANKRLTYIPDIQGSILATADSSTGTVAQAWYLAYGESANAAASFAYTGLRIDPEINGHLAAFCNPTRSAIPIGCSGAYRRKKARDWRGSRWRDRRWGRRSMSRTRFHKTKVADFLSSFLAHRQNPYVVRLCRRQVDLCESGAHIRLDVIGRTGSGFLA